MSKARTEFDIDYFEQKRTNFSLPGDGINKKLDYNIPECAECCVSYKGLRSTACASDCAEKGGSTVQVYANQF